MERLPITKQMYEDLKKPLDEKAVTKHPTKTYLSSIKAIYVTERLNDVFGCGKWQIRTEKISENDKGMIVVKTTLTIPDYGVYYESFGGNDNGGDANKNFDLGDAYKGATTDAITKICSYMGIGIEVFKGNGNVAPKEIVLPTLEIGTDSYNKCVQAFKNGYKIEDMRKKYTISEQVETCIKNAE